MDIDKMREAVIESQIACVTTQKEVWEIYGDMTGHTVTTITNALDSVITKLGAL